jgi:hypothetical protein
MASITAVIKKAKIGDIDYWLSRHLSAFEPVGTIIGEYGTIELMFHRGAYAYDNYPQGVYLTIQGCLQVDEGELIPRTDLMSVHLTRLEKTLTEMLFTIRPVNESVASSNNGGVWPAFQGDWQTDARAYGAQLFAWVRDLLVSMSSRGFKVTVIEETWDWVGVFPEYFSQFRGDASPAQIRPEVLAFPGRPSGRPRLEREELVGRLAAAIAAEELKRQPGRLTWKEVLGRLMKPPRIWPYG